MEINLSNKMHHFIGCIVMIVIVVLVLDLIALAGWAVYVLFKMNPLVFSLVSSVPFIGWLVHKFTYKGIETTPRYFIHIDQNGFLNVEDLKDLENGNAQRDNA